MSPQIRIPLLYGVVSAIYVYFSDHAVTALISDPHTVTLVSILKGWGFIGLTCLLLWWLIRGEVAAERARARERQALIAANIAAMNHVTRNFVNKMGLFVAQAEATPGFDPRALQLYGTIIAETTAEIERLSQPPDAVPGDAARLT